MHLFVRLCKKPYHGKLGGKTHEKFALRLLRKYDKEDEVEKYISLAVSKKPKDFGSALEDFLKYGDHADR